MYNLLMHESNGPCEGPSSQKDPTLMQSYISYWNLKSPLDSIHYSVHTNPNLKSSSLHHFSGAFVSVSKCIQISLSPAVKCDGELKGILSDSNLDSPLAFTIEQMCHKLKYHLEKPSDLTQLLKQVQLLRAKLMDVVVPFGRKWMDFLLERVQQMATFFSHSLVFFSLCSLLI